MFIESIKNSFKLSFISWTTSGKIVITGLKYQFDIGSAAKTNSTKFLTAAHWLNARAGVNKNDKAAIFDIRDARKYFVANGFVQYPKHSTDTDYNTN